MAEDTGSNMGWSWSASELIISAGCVAEIFSWGEVFGYSEIWSSMSIRASMLGPSPRNNLSDLAAFLPVTVGVFVSRSEGCFQLDVPLFITILRPSENKLMRFGSSVEAFPPFILKTISGLIP